MKKDKATLDDEKYIPFSSDCTMCGHFDDHAYCCVAFPSGIPTAILAGDQKHKSIVAGQKGDYVCTFILS